MEHIINVMQLADAPLHVNQIAKLAVASEVDVKACIKDQTGLGNINVVHTPGHHGNRYEWIGIAAQPQNVTIEPKQATNEPNLFTNELKDMIKSENTVETPSVVTPPINVKVGYMITAAKGKMERRKSHEAAKRLAGRWANDGHKNVVIHLTSEYERADVKPEVRFSRA